MTRGAFVAVVVLLVAAIAGFARLETVAAHERHSTRELRALVRQQVQVLAATRAQARQTRNGLREVCRQTQTLEGLAGAGARLARALNAAPNVNPTLRPAFANALAAFRGYQVIAAERPACREVLNP